MTYYCTVFPQLKILESKRPVLYGFCYVIKALLTHWQLWQLFQSSSPAFVVYITPMPKAKLENRHTAMLALHSQRVCLQVTTLFFFVCIFLYCSGNVSVLHAFTKVWREDFHSNNKIQNEAVEVMNNHTQIYSSGNMSYIQHTYICTIPVWWKVVKICIVMSRMLLVHESHSNYPPNMVWEWDQAPH